MKTRFRHLWLHLSLMSALLLAAVPTLGRIAETRQAPDATTLAAHFCGDPGAPATRLAALWQQEQALRQAIEQPEGERRHADCDYCPLLAALVIPAIPSLALAARPPALRGWQPVARIRCDEPHPCGLGSRGPPKLSRS